jgi:hypothetical protein
MRREWLSYEPETVQVDQYAELARHLTPAAVHIIR